MFEREQPRVVAIAPGDLVRVVTDRGDAHRFERRQLGGLEDAEWIADGKVTMEYVLRQALYCGLSELATETLLRQVPGK